jgi:hypothetical protein
VLGVFQSHELSGPDAITPTRSSPNRFGSDSQPDQKQVSFPQAEDCPTAVEYEAMPVWVAVFTAAVTAPGRNANSTFPFAGSAVKPSGGDSAAG